VDYDYEPAVLEGLAGHGLTPLPRTSPQFLRAALRELYRYEIKRLRTGLLAGRVPKADYVGEVIALRKRYWLLSVPLQLWTRRDAATSRGPTDIR
jgi:hypothetical protein